MHNYVYLVVCRICLSWVWWKSLLTNGRCLMQGIIKVYAGKNCLGHWIWVCISPVVILNMWQNTAAKVKPNFCMKRSCLVHLVPNFRFDLIFLILDPQDELYDRRLANHLVSLYFHGKEQREEENLVGNLNFLRLQTYWKKSFFHISNS